MSGLLNKCSVCCSVLSAWAIAQLVIMGIGYYIEATVLTEDVLPKEYDDYDDLIKKIKDNYSIVAMNCFVVAAIYTLMLGLSCLGLKHARKKARIEAARREDDDYICSSSIEKDVK